MADRSGPVDDINKEEGMKKIKVIKVCDNKTRSEALKIMKRVFLQEKHWIRSIEDQIPEGHISDFRYSWFLAKIQNQPAGLLRLVYDPSLKIPEKFKPSFSEGVNLEKLADGNRWVEVGRFMIVPEFRRYFRIALQLMRTAVKEVVERDFTHFITDVYENELHSPYHFHTRILGFERIGTHLYGELHCPCTRIILILDILKAYHRLKNARSRISDIILADVRNILEKKLKMPA